MYINYKIKRSLRHSKGEDEMRATRFCGLRSVVIKIITIIIIIIYLKNNNNDNNNDNNDNNNINALATHNEQCA